jgi:hypothetical protein
LNDFRNFIFIPINFDYFYQNLSIMSPKDTFFEYINSGYAIKGHFINLGAAMLGEETIADAFVKLPLKTLNRHGLIASATGIGKTKKHCKFWQKTY